MTRDIDKAYVRRLTIEGIVLFLAALVLVSGHAKAQAPLYNVQHNGTPEFSANNLTISGTTYNFTDGITPPPDPGAYQTLPVTWITHTPATATINVTQFFNIFGHILPNLPIQLWPGVSGVTVKYLDMTPKYVRARLHMPINGGTATHILKAVSYGATAGLRANFAVVAPGAPWPIGAATACWKPNQSFSDQPVLFIKPGAGSASFCGVALGADVDVLIDANTNGTVALSWY